MNHTDRPGSRPPPRPRSECRAGCSTSREAIRLRSPICIEPAGSQVGEHAGAAHQPGDQPPGIRAQRPASTPSGRAPRSGETAWVVPGPAERAATATECAPARRPGPPGRAPDGDAAPEAEGDQHASLLARPLQSATRTRYSGRISPAPDRSAPADRSVRAGSARRTEDGFDLAEDQDPARRERVGETRASGVPASAIESRSPRFGRR